MVYGICLILLFFRILQSPKEFVNIDTSFTNERSVMEKVIFSWNPHSTKHITLFFSNKLWLIIIRFISLGY